MIGTRLKEARKKKGLTVKKLAEMVGVSRVSATRWESGVHETDDDTKRKLARILDISVDYLVGDTDDPRPRVLNPTEMGDSGYVTENTSASKTGPKVFFASMMKRIRQGIGISPQDVAERTGIRQDVYEDYEAGRKVPDEIEIVLIAEALSCEAEDFWVAMEGGVPLAPRSETSEMVDRVTRILMVQNPDFVLHFRDVDNNRDVYSPRDFRAIADAVSIATGNATKEINQRMRKQSRHGDL
jgi:transcriptional regulator with XRE-family HTH domain